MRQYVNVIGILHMVYGGLQFVGALFAVLIVLMGAGLAVLGVTSGEEEMIVFGAIYAVVGVVVTVIVVAMALAYVIVGQGIRRQRSWARIGGFVAGAMAMLNMPLGTLLGVFTFIVLLDSDVAADFAAPDLPA